MIWENSSGKGAEKMIRMIEHFFNGVDHGVELVNT